MKKKLFIAIALLCFPLLFAACSVNKPDLTTFKAYADCACEATQIGVENAVYEDGYLLRETQKQYNLTQSGVVVCIKLTHMSSSLWEEARLVTEEYTESLSHDQVSSLLPVNVGEKLKSEYFEDGKYSISGNGIYFNVPDRNAASYLNTEQDITNLSVSVAFANAKISSYIATYTLPSGNTGRVKYVYTYAQ